jgi:hypothetical protein
MRKLFVSVLALLTIKAPVVFGQTVAFGPDFDRVLTSRFDCRFEIREQRWGFGAEDSDALSSEAMIYETELRFQKRTGLVVVQTQDALEGFSGFAVLPAIDAQGACRLRLPRGGFALNSMSTLVYPMVHECDDSRLESQVVAKGSDGYSTQTASLDWSPSKNEFTLVVYRSHIIDRGRMNQTTQYLGSCRLKR